MNTWRALFVSTESAKAHLWESSPRLDGPNGLHSLCGRVRVVNGLMLEPKQGDRQRCALCERALRMSFQGHKKPADGRDSCAGLRPADH